MKLLIIGAGGHGKVVAETAIACGYSLDFLDDKSPEAVGTLLQLDQFAPQYDSVFIGIGNNKTRKALMERVGDCPVLVNPAAYISPFATIGQGSIVLPGAVVHTGARVGRGCIISAGAIIDHDAVIGDYCHIDSGAICKSGSRVGDMQKIESGYVVQGY